ncbi:transient receptor potential cation channel subfamily A member 1-like isoform X1 [Scylla paramamosain]|uniref:transient receptor potential cation channel subfamily A member 1-like isoform X1 n=2 Tax=Scylla paramamosain TaxID=85552 RepID=UPI003083D5BD
MMQPPLWCRDTFKSLCAFISSRKMSTFPATLMRSLVAWRGKARRDGRPCCVDEATSPAMARYLQELLGTKADGEGEVAKNSPPDPNADVCFMIESPYRVLKVAAKGDVEQLRKMCLDDPTKLTLKDRRGWTVAHHAAAHDRPHALVFLHNQGADLEAKDDNGDTPFHVAVLKDAMEALDTLLDCGVNTSITNLQGDAPIHVAINNNKISVVGLLTRRHQHVDLFQKDSRGRTPLHLAAHYDFAQCAKAVLESPGFNRCPNEACNYGYHPIHLAARNASVGVLEALLRFADSRGCIREKMITIPDLEGNVPLHLAVHGGEIKAVELCLRNGALISTQQHDSSTPVHLACSQGSYDIVKLMFTLQPQEKKKALATQDAQGMSPLHCAAMFDHPQLVAYLLDEGADIDMVDKEHRSPLLLAAAHRGWRSIGVLLSHGADLTIRDSNHKNILHVVVMSGGCLIELLSLNQAQESWWKSRITHMLNEQDSLGWSPLHHASRAGQISSLAYLLRLGASVRTKDKRNESPLHFAAKYGRYNTVRQLVESLNGFLILNECNDEGKTALHIASEEGHTRVVQLLLGKGALLHRDHQGRTPLHLAAEGGHLATLTAILAVHSHTLDQTDKEGNTPLHLAVCANKPEVVSQLMTLNCKLVENNSKCTPIDIALHYKLFEASLALVTHPRGPNEVLSTSSQLNGCICMALIRTLPRVFEAVLDQAIVRANVKETSRNFFIKYSFYPFEMNKEQLEGERIRKKDPKFRPLPLYACNAMVDCRRVELLMHPLTQTFLEMKWRAYGKYIHLSFLIIYLVFLFLVTFFALGYLGHSIHMVPANFTTSSTLYSSTTPCTPQFVYEPQEASGCIYFSAVAILVFAVLNILKELVQLYHHKLKYLAEGINMVEWTMYLTSTCMVLPVIVGGEWKAQQFNSASLAVFTAWFTLLLYFQRFDRIGIYIVMFLEILNTLIKVLLVFSVLIIAFGLAFYILMYPGSHLSFSSVPMSVMHAFSMMLGEVDFLNIFVYPYFGESTKGDLLLFPITTFALLLIFMILMPILLMNLLIGLAVGDIESVKKNAQLKRIAMQVEMHTDLENKLPEMLIQRVNKTEVLVYPNAVCGSNWIHRILGALNFACPMNASKDVDSEAQDSKSAEEYLWEEIEDQRKYLKDMSGVLDQQTKLLRLIVQKMEIRSEADECDEGVSLEEIIRAPSVTRRFHSSSAVRRMPVPKKDI